MRNQSTPGGRDLPARMADRLIVALDVPRIDQARDMVARLDGVASFFKVGLWLAFAPGIDAFLQDLADARKQVFLDAKMFDIGQTVEQGVARAAERGVSFVTVHGDEAIVRAAVRGRGSSATRILAVSVLTSLGDWDLHAMGYRMGAQELVEHRVRQAASVGCDGVIASAHDDPGHLRRVAGSEGLLVVTPGVRPAGDPVQDHARVATPAQAIARGADYLVVGRPILGKPDPAAAARAIIAEMEQGAAGASD
jgi:orotidine-5'-phosphate decarboxylase